MAKKRKKSPLKQAQTGFRGYRSPELSKAYAGYYQSRGMAEGMMQGYSPITDMLITMGNQWAQEQEEDKQKVQAHIKRMSETMSKIPGVRHLSGRNHEILQAEIGKHYEAYDQAVEDGDTDAAMAAQRIIYNIQNDMKRVEGIYRGVEEV